MSSEPESAVSRAKRYLAISGVALEAMQVIGEAIAGITSRGAANQIAEVMAVLAGIQALAHQIKDGMDGEISKEEIEKSVQELRAGIAATNAAIDAALEKRFPQG